MEKESSYQRETGRIEVPDQRKIIERNLDVLLYYLEQHFPKEKIPNEDTMKKILFELTERETPETTLRAEIDILKKDQGDDSDLILQITYKKLPWKNICFTLGDPNKRYSPSEEEQASNMALYYGGYGGYGGAADFGGGSLVDDEELFSFRLDRKKWHY